jgi:type IV pilus assembly protein PilV
MKPISVPTQGPLGRGRQAGVMLLEALIAILIFSIGILAIVGMQASAIQNMGEAKYRSDAAFLANQIVADMWSNSTNLAGYSYSGSGTVPTLLQNWMNTAQSKLPGVNVATKKNLPIITIGANNTVTVTMRWKEGRDVSATVPHRYDVVAYINCCL